MLKRTYVAVGMAMLALAAAISSTGCAKQEFVKQEFVASASGIGVRYIPAKVDIVMVTDNTGSVNAAFNAIQSSLSSFVTTLSGKFWDYHVGRLPLTGSAPLGKVLVNSQYNTPYLPDGTYAGNVSGLVPSYAIEPSVSNFNLMSFPLATGSDDRTYSNLISNLNAIKSNNSINFLRQDSLLAVIVVTNGYESTVSDAYASSVNYSQLQQYANQLINIKGSPSNIRFYPVAARYYSDSRTGTYCYSVGSGSFRGDAYFAMNNYIRGVGTDFCDASAINSLLSYIDADLAKVRQNYVYSYLVLDEEPVDGSIVLTKHGQEIPNNPTNGWTYLGGPRTVRTVTHYQEDNGTLTPLSPALNERTGYVIQLNGSARVTGREDFDSATGAAEIEIVYKKK